MSSPFFENPVSNETGFFVLYYFGIEVKFKRDKYWINPKTCGAIKLSINIS
ncbi:hypothetical protein SAMN05443543_1102 [Flavobacterium flevense]|nr:hypothetical protein SAMN05443543_1102 [Flavobacterium flevense]